MTVLTNVGHYVRSTSLEGTSKDTVNNIGIPRSLMLRSDVST